MSDKLCTVTLVNRGVSFEAHPGQTLLEAARAAGVALPSGCRHGACLICAARLKGGKVQLPAGTALTPELLKEYFLLPCVTRAAGDCWIEVGQPGKPLLPSERRPRWTE